LPLRVDECGNRLPNPLPKHSARRLARVCQAFSNLANERAGRQKCSNILTARSKALTRLRNNTLFVSSQGHDGCSLERFIRAIGAWTRLSERNPMEFTSVLARRMSGECLRRITFYSKGIPVKTILQIFRCSASKPNAIEELHGAIIDSARKFAIHVSTWGSTFVGGPLEPQYEQLFQDEHEHSTRSYFNQLLLATEASCFFLHALNRRLGRAASRNFSNEIYDASVVAMIRWLMQISFLALGKESNSFNEEDFGRLIRARGLEYAQSSNLLSNEADDHNSAVWMAARIISDEISIKDSFDRDGYANHAILAHIIRTVLMLEFEVLNFASRLERISEAADHTLSACLEPIADQPQRLIDSAASSETRMRLPELMPDGSYTALQERLLTAFSLLFTRAATFGSIILRASNRIGRQRKTSFV
jgi:hypothetical protein